MLREQFDLTRYDRSSDHLHRRRGDLLHHAAGELGRRPRCLPGKDHRLAELRGHRGHRDAEQPRAVPLPGEDRRKVRAAGPSLHARERSAQRASARLHLGERIARPHPLGSATTLARCSWTWKTPPRSWAMRRATCSPRTPTTSSSAARGTREDEAPLLLESTLDVYVPDNQFRNCDQRLIRRSRKRRAAHRKFDAADFICD